MLTEAGALERWFDMALGGMAEPWAIVLALVLISFLLEDVAMAAGAALAVDGAIGWELAFLAVAGGIAVGDLGLYGFGGLARRVPRLRRWVTHARVQAVRDTLDRRLASALLLARAVPGLRLPTYSAAGFLAIPLLPFTLLVTAYVAAWTAALFWLAAAAGAAVAAWLGVSPGVALACLAVVLAVLPPLVRLLFRRRNAA